MECGAASGRSLWVLNVYLMDIPLFFWLDPWP